MFRLRSRHGRRPRVVPAAIVYIISTVVVIGGIFAWEILTRPAPVDPRDPAVRAKAAAQSITGQPAVRRVEVESGRVVVHATEGRLIVQLILYDLPSLRTVRVELYTGRHRVAAVEGTAQQRYDDYTVTYHDGSAP